MYRVNRLAVKELKSSAQNSSAAHPHRIHSSVTAVLIPCHQPPTFTLNRPDPSRPVITTRLSVMLKWSLSGLVLRGPLKGGDPGWDTWPGNPPAITRPVAPRWAQLCHPHPSESTPCPRPLSPPLLISSPHLLIPSEAHQTSAPRLPLTTY